MAHFRLNQVCRLGMAHLQRSLNGGAIGLSKPSSSSLSSPATQILAGSIQVRYRYNPKNLGIAFPREGIEETDEEFDARYIKYFSRPDIDGWELRKGINDLHGFDLVPEPAIIIEVLKACRRLNEHSVAVRYLEAVWRKANYKKHIIDYLMQEIKPTLDELGVSTPEEMGYDEPELALGDAARCSLIEKPPNYRKGY